MKQIEKISIIGVGFMGASLSLALKDVFPQAVIWGYARNRSSWKRLGRLKVVDCISCDLEKVVHDSDIVILALPVFTIIDFFKKIKPFLKKGALLVDIGSSKQLISAAAKKYLPSGVSFVGCHPLCGSNHAGAEYADKNLYRGALCLITSRSRQARIVAKIWRLLGCTIRYMSPGFHDQILGYVSHLPHVVSYSLSGCVPKKYLAFAPNSFRDATRVSSSPANVWADIFISNRRYMLKNIREYIKIVARFEKLIKRNDKRSLIAFIQKIHTLQGKNSR